MYDLCVVQNAPHSELEQQFTALLNDEPQAKLMAAFVVSDEMLSKFVEYALPTTQT